MRRTLRKHIRNADKALRIRFAPYVALDGFGTFQMCYTEAGAREWLPALSPDGRILLGGRTIARRNHG
jgi:hypothetical protein